MKSLSKLALDVYDRHDFVVKDIEIIRGDPGVYAFRGSDELADWIRDIRFCPWWTRGLGWTPAGFVKAADDCARAVLKDNVWGASFVLTGHSLGGAIALLTGALLTYKGLPVSRIETYGAPRVGRLKLLDNLPVAVYRNHGDFIPFLPPLYRNRPPEIIQAPERGHSMLSYHAVLGL